MCYRQKGCCVFLIDKLVVLLEVDVRKDVDEGRVDELGCRKS